VAACLDTVRGQAGIDLRLLVVDNGSADATPEVLEQTTAPSERVLLDRNTGFSAAHNLALSRTSAPYYLALNPDVFLEPGFIATLLEAVSSRPGVGAATGKLLLASDPSRLDSTGIYLLPSQRHLDRGQGEPDRGQYDRVEAVFGASGAAAFYRRAMLEDVAVRGEVFDEDFFAYREDVDLAWRAQIRGWQCLYVPAARARHVRRVTPERRAGLPAAINRMSVRNRFLLRLKNQPLGQFLRFAVPGLVRDLQVVAYVAACERTSLPALWDVVRLLPVVLAKRRVVLSGRRTTTRDLNRWFREPARPAPPAFAPPGGSR